MISRVPDSRFTTALRQSRRARARVPGVLTSVGLYLLLFFVFYPRLGNSTTVLMVPIVILCGLFWGIRGGMFAGIAAVALNILLLYLMHPTIGWTDLLRAQDSAIAFVILVSGVLVGLARNAPAGAAALPADLDAVRLRALMEHSWDAFLFADPNGIILYASSSTLRVLGYMPSEITGKSAASFFHPEDVEQVRAQMRRIVELPSETTTVLARARHKTGVWRWIEGAATNMLAEPQVQALVVNYHDVTAHKIAETRYRSIFENAVEGIFQSTADGKFLSVNPALARLYKYDSPQAMMASVQDIANEMYVNARERDTFREKLQRDGLVLNFEVQDYCRDRSKIWVSQNARAVRDENGALLYYEGTIVDITARKQAEAAQAKKLNALRTLSQNTHVVLGMTDSAMILDFAPRCAVSVLDTPLALLVLNAPYSACRSVGLIAADCAAAEFIALAQNELLPARAFQIPDRAALETAGDAQGFAAFCAREQVQAAAGVPLYSDGVWLGALFVFDRAPRAWTQDDAQLLELVGSEMALIFQKARFLDQLQKRAQEMTVLYETTRDLALSNEPALLLRTIAERAGALLHTLAAGIYLYDAGRDQVEFIASSNMAIPIGTRLRRGEGMAGQIIATRQPLVLDNYHAWEGRSPQYDAVPFTATLSVPMLSRGELIGVLTVSQVGDTSRRFTDDDAQLLSLFAAHTASAVRSARLLAEAEQHSKQLTVLHQAALEFAKQTDVTALLEKIVTTAAALVDAPNCALKLYDPAKDVLVVTVTRGADLPIGTELSLREGAIGRVVETREPVIANDYAHWEFRSPAYAAIPYTAVMGVPMMYGGELIGALDVGLLDGTRSFTEQDAQLLSLVAAHAAEAVHNARLLEQARRRAQEAETLRAASAAVAANLDEQAAMVAIFEQLAHVVPFDSGSVQLLRDGYLEIIGGTGWSPLVETQMLHLPIPGENPNTRVIQEKRAQIEADVQARYTSFQGGGQDFIRGWLGVPLILQERIIGVLALDSLECAHFTAEHARLVAAFANQVAIALENTRLFKQVRSHARHLSILNQVARTITGILDMQELVRVVTEQVRGAYDFMNVAVFTAEPNTRMLVMEYVAGVYHETVAPGELLIPYGRGIIGMTAETGVIQVFNHVSQAPGFFQLEGGEIQSEMGIPLKVGEQVIGVLNIDSAQPDTFTPGDVEILTTLGEQFAVAWHKARLFQETRLRLKQLEAINNVSSLLRAALTLDEMLPRVLDETLHVLETDAGSISLSDPLSDRPSLDVSRGWFTQFAPARVLRGQGITGHVHQTGNAYTSAEFATDPLTRPGARQFIPRGWGGVCLPLQTAHEIVGVMYLAVPSPRTLNQSDLNLLATVAEMLGSAIHRARLYEETQLRLQHLASLRAIDLAISTSFDMRVMLGVLVEQVMAQTGAHAVAILVLNAHLQRLEFGGGRGFHSRLLERTPLRLGEGVGGRAALKQQIVFLADLSAEPNASLRSVSMASEDFAAYLAVPLVTRGQTKGLLEIFHRAPLEQNPPWLDFVKALGTQAAIAFDNIALFNDLQRSNMDLNLAYEATLEGWSRALDLRDHETEGHTQRVAELSLRLGRAMGIGEEELVQMRRGALLHDIGKMGIPDNILLKPGPLTPGERDVMRRHPEYAYELLAPIDHLRAALDIPLYHHEKWDGTGYPRGLHGEKIPLTARIFAVVDVWDALRSRRPYQDAWTEARALEYIRAEAGKHFDPRVVTVFLEMLQEARVGAPGSA